MKILADESVDKQIVGRLRAHGHDVLFVAELDPGIDDEVVLGLSRKAEAILVTADRDFGELHLLHTGVLLIRLAGLKPDNRWTASMNRPDVCCGNLDQQLGRPVCRCPLQSVDGQRASPLL